MNVRKLLVPLSLVFFLTSSSTVFAQEADTTDQVVLSRQEALADFAGQTSSDLDEIRSEISGLEREVQRSSGEVQALALSRLDLRRTERHALMHSLVGAILGAEEDSLDTEDMRAVVERYMPDQTSELLSEVVRLQQEEQRTRGQRDSATPEEQVVLGQQLDLLSGRENDALGGFGERVGQLELLGMDASGEVAFLESALEARGEEVSARLALSRDLRRNLNSETDPAGEQQRVLDARIARATEALQVTAGLMDERGLETSAYRRLLIQATGNITEDILDADVALGLISGWMESIQEWFRQNAPSVAFKLILFLLILLVTRTLARLAGRALERVLRLRAESSELLLRTAVSLAIGGITAVGVLLALSQIGVEVGPLLAGLGVVGFIVGFALQGTLANLASGLLILFYRPFDVGDTITAGGVTGQVLNMTLTATTLQSPDFIKLTVPNGKIWGGVIENKTANKYRAVLANFLIDPREDIEQVLRLLLEVTAENESVLPDPAPSATLVGITEKGLSVRFRATVPKEGYLNHVDSVLRDVKRRLDAAGVAFAYRILELAPSRAATRPGSSGPSSAADALNEIDE
jgi:small conductance mechanosensitive channel